MATPGDAAAFSEKERELIAVGASVAAGCLPCTRFHREVAARAGAGQDEILLAVREATQVRLTATAIMATAGGLSLTPASLPQLAAPDRPSAFQHLVAIGAAYAISCATTLGAQLEAARACGATDQQLFAALQIACAIRKVALQKARAVAGTALGVTPERAAELQCGEEVAQGDAAHRAGGPCSC
jgi:AhpD family alkylhydroperoxidase